MMKNWFYVRAAKITLFEAHYWDAAEDAEWKRKREERRHNYGTRTETI